MAGWEGEAKTYRRKARPSYEPTHEDRGLTPSAPSHYPRGQGKALTAPRRNSGGTTTPSRRSMRGSASPETLRLGETAGNTRDKPQHRRGRGRRLSTALPSKASAGKQASERHPPTHTPILLPRPRLPNTPALTLDTLGVKLTARQAAKRPCMTGAPQLPPWARA